MAAEIRELLEQGAGGSVGMPDVEAIWARRTKLVWRRRAALAVGLVLVGLGVAFAGSSDLLFGQEEIPPAQRREGVAAQVPFPIEVDTLLSSGPHETQTFRDGFDFELERAVWFVFQDEPTVFDIGINAGRSDVDLSVQLWEEVYDPVAERFEPASRDLVGWVRGHPFLELKDAFDISIGGVNGRALDVSVHDPTKRPACRAPQGTPNCGFPLGKVPDWYIYPYTRALIVVLHHGDSDVVAILRAPTHVYRTWFLEESMAVLSSVRFND